MDPSEPRLSAPAAVRIAIDHPWANRLRLGGILALLALQAVILWRFFPFTAEDAFIVYRYAENAVHGHGLVFNVTDPPERINALTSPLHALLCAALFALFGATVVAAKVAGIAAVLAAEIAALSYLRRRSASMMLFAALIVPSPFLALWTIGGLETPILLLNVTLVLLVSMRFHSRPSAKAAAALSVLAAACFLTRYDSVLFAGPVLLAAVIRKPRQAAALILPGGLLIAAWLGFSLSYYHDVFPTSYYIKTPTYTAVNIRWNARYLQTFFGYSGLMGLTVVVLLRVAARGRAAASALREHLAASWGADLGFLAIFAYGLGSATTHMMFCNRMVLPYLPAFVLTMLDLASGSRDGQIRRPRWQLLPEAVLALLMIAVSIHIADAIDRRTLNPGPTGEYLRVSRRGYVEGFARALRESAGEVREHWKRTGAERAIADRGPRPRVAVFAAGIMPYYFQDCYIYDLLGSFRKKCDPGGSPAHYILLLTPLLGSVESSLPLPLSRYELVSEHRFEFEGAEQTLSVLFRNDPDPYRMPLRVDGPCLDAPPP